MVERYFKKLAIPRCRIRTKATADLVFQPNSVKHPTAQLCARDSKPTSGFLVSRIRAKYHGISGTHLEDKTAAPPYELHQDR
jgi:hypothetical protein